MLQYRANKCVFKSLRKLSLVTLGSLKLSGNRLSSRASHRKARRPYVNLKPMTRKYMTRSHRLADLRCCREAMSETGRQRSTKYCGAWPCRQLCTMMQSLYVTGSGRHIEQWTWQWLNHQTRNCWLLHISDFYNTADKGTCSFAVLLMLVSW